MDCMKMFEDALKHKGKDPKTRTNIEACKAIV